MTKSGKCFSVTTKRTTLFEKFFKNLLTNNAKYAIIVSVKNERNNNNEDNNL